MSFIRGEFGERDISKSLYGCQAIARRACRRGVRAHPAPGGNHHGVHGGQGAGPLLEAGGPFDYDSVRELTKPTSLQTLALSLPGVPELRV